MNKGFTVKLGDGDGYRRLRAAQHGLYYWDVASQQIILAELGEFFPHVTEADGCGVFSKVADGREVCSRSSPIGRGKIPRTSIVALEQAVSRLQSQLSDPHLTPEARMLIENFKLPDPARLPDFYRYVDRDRILVIWGCERTNLDSIAPRDAIAKLPKEGWFAELWRRGRVPLTVLAILALIALIIGLIMAWPRARLNLAKAEAAPGEPVRVDVAGSKGDWGAMTWNSSAEVKCDAVWKPNGDLSVETMAASDPSGLTHSPVDLRFGTDGEKIISFAASNHYLGIPLPKSVVRRTVRVIAPDRPTRTTKNRTPLDSEFVSAEKHLTVKLVSPPGIYPAILDAIADSTGQIDFAGQRQVKCESQQPVRYDGFTKPGIYRVEFSPSSAPLKKDAAFVRLDPLPNGNPVVANLRLSKTQAMPGERVYADSGASYHTEPEGRIVERQISIDGGKTFEALPDSGREIPLLQPGKVQVVLRLKDNKGRTAEDSGVVSVEAPKSPTQQNIDQVVNSGGNFYIPEELLFPSGTASISPEGQALLRKFAEQVRKQIDTIKTIEIVGHTDNVRVRPGGPFSDNIALSEARAQAAADVLLSTVTPPPGVLRIQGAGEGSPLVPNTSAQNQAKNRRIQIKVELKVASH